jgi:hypothetical protein
VVTFYNQHGKAEQYIKEGKNAIKWTRLLCWKLCDNEIRLQLHALVHNLANFMQTFALPKEGGALIIEHATGEAREDRGQSCPPWPARHISINRSSGAAKPVPENPGIDELSTTKTRSGVGRGNRR